MRYSDKHTPIPSLKWSRERLLDEITYARFREEELRADLEQAAARAAATHAVVEQARDVAADFEKTTFPGPSHDPLEMALADLDTVPVDERAAQLLAIKNAARAMFTKFGNGPDRAENELRRLLGLGGRHT